jgi:hypothetical protein
VAKADKALVARRVEEVLRIRLDGAEFWDVREYVREKEAEPGSAWHLEEGAKPLSDGQIRRYQQRADALLERSHERSRKKLLRRHLAKRRNLYAKAVLAGDVRAALACLRDECELLGLYAPKKVAPTTPDGKGEYTGVVMSDEERVAALERLYASVRARGGGAPPDGPAGGDGPLLGGHEPLY